MKDVNVVKIANVNANVVRESITKSGKGVLNQMEKNSGSRNQTTGYNFVRGLRVDVHSRYDSIIIPVNNRECRSWFNGVHRS